jgi:peptide deformylase
MTEEATGQILEDEGELDAEQQIRRRLALAQLRHYPDPVLRMTAREVTEFGPELETLVRRMTQLMHDAHGVGLAANQVGIIRRVFVFQRDEENVLAVVNPVITERGEELETDNEGCLSLQGVTVPVERTLHLTLEGRDEHGGELRLELEGTPARVVQHELDHLDGTLILDRTTDEARKAALAVLRPQPVLASA